MFLVQGQAGGMCLKQKDQGDSKVAAWSIGVALMLLRSPGV